MSGDQRLEKYQRFKRATEAPLLNLKKPTTLLGEDHSAGDGKTPPGAKDDLSPVTKEQNSAKQPLSSEEDPSFHMRLQP